MTPPTSGATIAGAILGMASGGASGLALPAATGGGVTVSVVGTASTAVLDGQGRFTLTNVPAGTQRLQFDGPGVSGSVTVEDVQVGATIDLSLSLDGI